MRTRIRLMLATIIVILLAAFGPAVVTLHARRFEAAPAQARSALAQASSGSALQAMLGSVPAELPDLDDPDQAIIAYADIATQLDAFDLAAEGMTDDGIAAWAAATTGLPLPSPALQYQQSFGEDYGFDLVQVDRTLSIALPPFELSLYRGRFDQARIIQALREVGYTPVGSDARPILSIRGDYEQDISAPTAYKLSAMNYATILDDGTLAFSSAQGPLEAVLEVESGERPSLAERSDMEALGAGLPDDLVSAHIVHGSALAYGVPDELLAPDAAETPDLEAIATEIADQSDMPPIAMALLGFTAGGPVTAGEEVGLPADGPDARAVIALQMLSDDAATIAAPIIEERLATGSSAQTGQPYAELFPKQTVEVVTGTPVVRIDLVLGEDVSRGILMQLLYNRDLGFLAW
jgi:hypothetical protein